jgi:hypothetical protein
VHEFRSARDLWLHEGMIRRESICGTMETVQRHGEGAWASNRQSLGGILVQLHYFLGARDRELFPDAKRKSEGLWALIYVLRQCKYPLNILMIATLRVL